MANLGTHNDFPVRYWELILYILIAVSGITGNTLVLIVINRNKQIGSTAFGIYIGALAFADLLVCILCLPIYLTSTSWYENHPTGTAGDVMCKLLTGYTILFFLATVSVYTLVAILYERYVAICKPFESRIKSTPKRAKIIIFFIYLLSLLIGIPPVIGENYAPEEKASIGAHCTFSNAYNNNAAPKIIYAVIFSLQYIFPITFMVICFVKIKRCLHGKKKEVLGTEAKFNQAGELQMIKVKKQSVRTVLIVVVSYFLCWSLNQVLYFCLNFGIFSGINWNSDLMQISIVFCFLSSCINPFIYTLRSKQFRDEFARLLCLRCKSEVNTNRVQT